MLLGMLVEEEVCINILLNMYCFQLLFRVTSTTPDAQVCHNVNDTIKAASCLKLLFKISMLSAATI